MIKKYLLGLGISFLGFLGFSSATFQTFIIGNDKYASNWNNQYDIGFLKNGRFLTNYLGVGKPLVGLNSQYLIFWNDGLYLYTRKYSGIFGTLQGYFQYYKSCDEITTDMTGDSLQNCTSAQKFEYNNDEIVNNFLSSLVVGDFVFINERNGGGGCGGYCTYNRYMIDFCFSSSVIGKTMCFVGDKSDYESSFYASRTPFIHSLGFGSGVNFSNINSSYLQNPPGFNNNYNPGEIENITGDIYEVPTDIDRYIEYYESKYGWDESVCYVGTDDLTGAYGKPGLSFQYGSGATMFSLYHTIYGTFGQSLVKNVGKFLNCWLINYNQWWDTISDERSYFCTDNGPEINISLSYDVSENPFKNNRAAIYFLIDNLYNHQYRIDTSSPMFESSMGDEYAFYCAAKLNYENYKNGTLDFSELEDQVDPILKDIIGDWNNRNLGSQYGFSVPNMSGNDNIWGNLIQTGSGIPDDLNPSGLFKQFYDRINNLLQNFSPKTSFGFIPLWILYPMLFLILFRILRH